jgi:hypothetical protein
VRRNVAITIDKEHGVNPSMYCCFFCNEPIGVVLWGKLTAEQRKAFDSTGLPRPSPGQPPRNVVLDKNPCDKCESYMQESIILISCREPREGEDLNNPYRTGGWCVVKESAIRKMIKPIELANEIIQKRVAFVPDDAWKKMFPPTTEESKEA